MYEDFVQSRLAYLRTQKGVSARDMSLSLGQNDSYVNRIENKKALPSMQGFFYICEYLGITPQEFFEEGNPNPERLREIVENLKLLDDNALSALTIVVNEMADKKQY